ncbi:GTPase Era, mitochondrial-like isoform X1 [Corticium candelabrum]|uniref:GTPase Era, mitochondrial-like isoform X1 n=1 Tax=Corticium candelabrum TaxID=121492 RepID=UPI002E272CF4|nr:GTPase Era, mitochondrial-like isoform X1 [Corticium candelabrum]
MKLSTRSCSVSLPVILVRRILTCAAVRPVEQPESPRILKVAVLGSPNVGKSTLINVLIGKKVAAVSDKPQTTREACLAVLTKGNAQILLTDTPGVIHHNYGRKHRMSKSLMSGAMGSLLGTDLAAVVVDLSRKRQRMAIDENVVKLLQEYRNVPSILVLNKVTGFTVCCKSYTALQSLFSEAASCSQVDTVRDKFSILPVIDRLTCKKLLDPLKTGGNGLKYTPDAGEDGVVSLNEGGWPNFHEVLVVSAASGEGINTLLDYLFSLAYPGCWLYNSDESVALPLLKIVEEMVREQLFAHLYQEIPYVITQTNLHLSRDSDNVLEIHQALNCQKECQRGILIGKNSLTLESMRCESERQLEQLLGPLRLRLIVRVAPR